MRKYTIISIFVLLVFLLINTLVVGQDDIPEAPQILGMSPPPGEENISFIPTFNLQIATDEEFKKL